LRTNKNEIINLKVNLIKKLKELISGDLISIRISLINEIRDLIEEVSKFGADLG